MKKFTKRFITFVLIIAMIFSFSVQASAAKPKWLNDVAKIVEKVIVKPVEWVIEQVIVKPVEWAAETAINKVIIPYAEDYAQRIVDNPERALAELIVVGVPFVGGGIIPSPFGGIANFVVKQAERIGIIPSIESSLVKNSQNNDYWQTQWRDGYWDSSSNRWVDGYWVSGSWVDGYWAEYWVDSYWVDGYCAQYWIDGYWINGYWVNGYWVDGK